MISVVLLFELSLPKYLFFFLNYIILHVKHIICVFMHEMAHICSGFGPNQSSSVCLQISKDATETNKE